MNLSSLSKSRLFYMVEQYGRNAFIWSAGGCGGENRKRGTSIVLAPRLDAKRDRAPEQDT
jgi:hypothetical protein